MRKHFLTLIAFFAIIRLQAQEFEFSKAEKLNEDINSEAEEINPRITEDGSTLYFTRTFSAKNMGGKYAGQDIWYSKSEGVDWSKPKNLKALNNGDNNAVVGFDDTGSKLYLINNYTAHPVRELGLVVSEKKTDKKWSDIEALPVKVEVLNDHYGFYLTPDEQVLIISMMADDAIGKEDLYVSFNENGTWTQPKHMGTAINSEGYEISPFLSKDKKTLYFGSEGFDGEGSSDIFSSTRLDDTWTNWTAPKNLGSTVNSSAFDAYFVMSNSGNAYFASNRGLTTGLSDIYYTKGTPKPEEVEEQPEIVVEEDEEEVEEEITEEPEKPEEPELEPMPANTMVYFDFNSASLTAESKMKLDEVVKTMNSRQMLSISLSGHADQRGSEEYNKQLSERRAKAVKKYLSDKLKKDTKVEVYFYGENRPASTGNSESAHKENRRVEVDFRQSN
ncbi:MAG: OmpA family protein [Cyclobacteriaceae bacterium]